jgi:DNA uptake protein ComE-like DNA-binding protein
MWKDYLHFTKKERNGVLLFFLVIILVFSAKFFIPRQASTTYPAPEAIAPAKSSDGNRQQQRHSSNKTARRNASPSREIYHLHDFDPNTADSLTLRGLGLKPFIAKNIVKYRNKGGKFRKPEDFSKLYGMDAQKFEELRPYIKIASREDSYRPASSPKPEKQGNFQQQTAEMPTPKTSPASPPPDERPAGNERPFKYPPGTQVDIAKADTTELKKIPRIGSAFAGRIVKYRQLLGGYHCVEQIREIYGMTPELYRDISPWLTVSEGHINRLSANTLSVEKLKSHPYINFYQAKAIVDLKRKSGKLQAMDSLSLLEEFSEADFHRLKPYLSFD